LLAAVATFGCYNIIIQIVGDYNDSIYQKQETNQIFDVN
jgi:hypothetical protein